MKLVRYNKIIYVKQESYTGEISGVALHFDFACDKTREYLKKLLIDVNQMIDEYEQQAGKSYNDDR